MRRKILGLVAAGLLVHGCGLPFTGQRLPSTTELINSATDYFAKASSLEVSGIFNQGGYHYMIDMQITQPDTAHITIVQNNLSIEVVQANGKRYFRGKDFLARVAGTTLAGQRMAKAIGPGWFTSKDANSVDMTAFTDVSKVKANFLNTRSLKRNEIVGSDGVKTAELIGTDYTLYITEPSPHRLVFIRTAKAGSVEQVTDAELAFTNYNRDFGIQAPTRALDLDDHATWPPLYFRVSMSPARCQDPCVLTAVFQNDGGTAGAPAPSTVTFTLTNHADEKAFGTCAVTIRPDVPNGSQVTESCSISSPSWSTFSGTYTYNAVVTNPAYD
jgi:hypothetical protein